MQQRRQKRDCDFVSHREIQLPSSTVGRAESSQGKSGDDPGEVRRRLVARSGGQQDRMVSLQLHPGGVGRRSHLLHGRKRVGHHGGTLFIQGTKRYRVEF